MYEQHRVVGPARGDPLAADGVGMRIRVPPSGMPSPRWSLVLKAHLINELTGHATVGHLDTNGIVQGAEIVLEGVEEPEVHGLGGALTRAIQAANNASQTAHAQPPAPRNVALEEAARIARKISLNEPARPLPAARQPPLSASRPCRGLRPAPAPRSLTARQSSVAPCERPSATPSQHIPRPHLAPRRQAQDRARIRRQMSHAKDDERDPGDQARRGPGRHAHRRRRWHPADPPDDRRRVRWTRGRPDAQATDRVRYDREPPGRSPRTDARGSAVERPCAGRRDDPAARPCRGDGCPGAPAVRSSGGGCLMASSSPLE
jgi:hypothetical protein